MTRLSKELTVIIPVVTGLLLAGCHGDEQKTPDAVTSNTVSAAPSPVASSQVAASVPVAMISPDALACNELNACFDASLAAATHEDAESLRHVARIIDGFPKPDLGNKATGRDLNKQALDGISKNDYAGAESLLEQAYKANPRDVEIAANYGLVLVHQHKADAALTVLKAALALDPRRSSTWVPTAMALAAKGDSRNATAALWIAYQWSPHQDTTINFYAQHSTGDPSDQMTAVYAQAMSWIRDGQYPRFASPSSVSASPEPHLSLAEQGAHGESPPRGMSQQELDLPPAQSRAEAEAQQRQLQQKTAAKALSDAQDAALGDWRTFSPAIHFAKEAKVPENMVSLDLAILDGLRQASDWDQVGPAHSYRGRDAIDEHDDSSIYVKRSDRSSQRMEIIVVNGHKVTNGFGQPVKATVAIVSVDCTGHERPQILFAMWIAPDGAILDQADLTHSDSLGGITNVDYSAGIKHFCSS